ncbi:hypothetical protein ATM99_07230 [Cellulomonas sp. B6]|nr:hypothetical protein ATM99_07230 [Cellulomonas sp. B6]
MAAFSDANGRSTATTTVPARAGSTVSDVHAASVPVSSSANPAAAPRAAPHRVRATDVLLQL